MINKNPHNNQPIFEHFNDAYVPSRPNRLCVSVSDLHLTDGSVGFQNLEDIVWEEFYGRIATQCKDNDIEEVVLVLDGDIVDMVRTARWPERDFYPWQRNERKVFSEIVNALIQDIVSEKHQYFFTWLKQLESRLIHDAKVKSVEIVILLGNHDKELLCDNEALTYFYQEGLGKSLQDFSDTERARLGRMYGDETMFADKSTAPYFPFYYADRGFRFFVTHGQWRDATNCRKIYAINGKPGWTVKDGWQMETWQALKFSPFLEPCFGDTIASGLLSTFIYETKKRLTPYVESLNKEAVSVESIRIHNDVKRLESILNELDLYRPTYKAIVRILKESSHMKNHDLVVIVEETLFACIIKWLDCDFTYESSSLGIHIFLKLGKFILKFLKFIKLHKFVALSLVRFVLKGMMYLDVFKSFIKKIFALMKGQTISESDLSLKDLKGFPAFMSDDEKYRFQIHGEGHTHIPLEDEPNIRKGRPTTYVNFGTWRDQILGRKNHGYRRRGVLRAFYILDLKGENGECDTEEHRRFRYFTNDIIKWSDKLDSLT